MEQPLSAAEREQQTLPETAIDHPGAHGQKDGHDGHTNGRKGRGSMLFLLAGLLWIAAFVPGIRSLMKYERTPGMPAVPLEMWPADVRLADVHLAADNPATAVSSANRVPQQPGGDAVDAQLPTLVVALHPLCTCSRATLTELEAAAATFQHPYRAVLLVYQPRGSGAAWQQTGLYQEAARVLHAQVVEDVDGAIAARFGAQTSGQVFLYSGAASPAKRRLLFAGGVTAARGETGENQGLYALEDAFQKEATHQNHSEGATWHTLATGRSPVFGCGLFKLSRLEQRNRQ